LLRGLVAKLVRIEVVVSEFDSRVSLACHSLSFLRTVFLGVVAGELGRCIGLDNTFQLRAYAFFLRILVARIRVQLLESGGERIQLHSSSVPPSHNRDNAYRPEDRKERKKE